MSARIVGNILFPHRYWNIAGALEMFESISLLLENRHPGLIMPLLYNIVTCSCMNMFSLHLAPVCLVALQEHVKTRLYASPHIDIKVGE